MRIAWIAGLIVLATSVNAKPSLEFYNEISLNAHFYLIDLALRGDSLPDELLSEPSSLNAFKAYTDITSLPRFHPLFSNNHIAHTSSLLISGKLLQNETCSSLCSKLDSFIPVYEASIWSDIERQNAQWITSSRRLLEQYATPIYDRLNRYFAVDIAPTSHRFYVVDNTVRGAFTSGRAPSTVMSSGNEEYQGFNALEMIFHEMVHTYGASRSSPLRAAISAQFGDDDKAPSDLWHLIHFYTVGYAVKTILSDAGIDYMPYADEYGLYSGRWLTPSILVKTYWTPYLEGQVSMQEALANIQKHM